MDTLSKNQRSYNMSRIRSKDTKPELTIRKYLFSKGFRYRIHFKKLPGKPDVVLPKYNAVILVHGCFWHQHHDCKLASSPKTNSTYWHNKLASNKLRDDQQLSALKALGWRVLVVWECEVKPNNILKLQQIADWIKNYSFDSNK